MGEQITKFKATVNYRLARGYGSNSTFASGTTCEPVTAIIEAIKELAWIAHLGGFGDKAVAEAQAVVGRAKALGSLPKHEEA